MKKLFVLILALALCGAAMAEEGAFALENGATWGMTQGDVLAIEGTSGVDYETYRVFEVLEVEDTAFRGREADVEYLFFGDALTMVAYDLDEEDVAPQALVEQLDGEYGAHTEDKGKTYYDVMSRLTGTTYTAQPEVTGIGVYWTLPDGTAVTLLTGMEKGDDDIHVFYISPALLRMGVDADVSEPAPALDD